MADAVAGFGKEDAASRGKGLQESVVVGILKSGLKHIVVHIADRELSPDPRNPQRLKLKAGHRARGILREGLVNGNGDVFMGR